MSKQKHQMASLSPSKTPPYGHQNMKWHRAVFAHSNLCRNLKRARDSLAIDLELWGHPVAHHLQWRMNKQKFPKAHHSMHVQFSVRMGWQHKEINTGCMIQRRYFMRDANAIWVSTGGSSAPSPLLSTGKFTQDSLLLHCHLSEPQDQPICWNTKVTARWNQKLQSSQKESSAPWATIW